MEQSTKKNKNKKPMNILFAGFEKHTLHAETAHFSNLSRFKVYFLLLTHA